MKIKVLYGSFCVSVCTIIVLSLYIVNREPICERLHLDEIDRTKNIVSDEEMAKDIAELYIRGREKKENYEGEDIRSLEVTYNVEVIFNEKDYEWIVGYTTIPPEGHYILDGEFAIRIRRDNGMVDPISRK